MDESAKQNINDNVQDAGVQNAGVQGVGQDVQAQNGQGGGQANGLTGQMNGQVGQTSGQVNDQGLTPEQEEAINSMSDAELMDAFADQMMKDKGLKDQLDEATYAALKKDLIERIVYQVNRAILAQLPEDKLQEVGAKMDGGELSAEELDNAVREAGVDVAQTTQDVMLTFRDAYLGMEEK